MSRLIHAAALAVALASCSDSTDPYNHGNDRIIIPTGACVANPQGMVVAERLEPVEGNNGCKISEPWRLSAVSNVRLTTPAMVTCGLISPLHGWLMEIVQPAAARAFGEPVVSVDVAASYACRPRNSNQGAKISEHGFGKAIDISAFTLAGGREVKVAGGWYGSTGERAFLREVHRKACGRFSTVLGPASDGYHRDHIHLDIQARKSGKAFCQ